MSERYKKLTSHGAISIPVAMRRDIGLQGGSAQNRAARPSSWLAVPSTKPFCRQAEVLLPRMEAGVPAARSIWGSWAVFFTSVLKFI